MAGNDLTQEVWGVDLGAMKTMVVTKQGQIIRNELGGIGTATLVSFQGRERHLGEAAVAQVTANTRNTVLHLHRLIGRAYKDIVSQDSHLTDFYMFKITEGPGGSVLVSVDYEGETVAFPPYLLLGMLLGKLKQYTLEGTVVQGPLALSIAVPRGFPDAHIKEVMDAARVAGVEDVSVVSSADALLATYRYKHPSKDFTVGEVRKVLLVEVGHSQTTVLVAELAAEGDPIIMAEESDVSFGAANFDHRLFQHFRAYIEKKDGATVAPGDKKAMRLLAAVEKIRKHLSTIPEAISQVENVVEGRDIDLTLRREEFATLAAEEVTRFTTLIKQCLSRSGVAPESLNAVEISGGAMRMPLLQETLTQATGFGRQLGMKLDDAAIAFGAALLRARMDAASDGAADSVVRTAEATTTPTGGAEELKVNGSGTAMDVDGVVLAPAEAVVVKVHRGEGKLSSDEVQRLRAEEARREAVDKEIHALAEVRNSIESFILQLRGAPSSKHGKLVDRATLDPFVDGLENWLYSEEADTSSLADFTAKLASAKDEAGSLLQAYNEAVEQDRLAYEKSLEEEAKKAEAERDAAGDDDDHDNRKLKKPERMRLVLKNKEEGNELFGGGNHRPAAARYVKALTHCAKFFDLGPSDQEEVDNIKLSLYSNLAQCYIKLANWDAAIKNCEEALKIKADFVKALYRRAVAYDAKKMHEEAEKDLTRASELAPTDKLVQNLLTRTKLAIKKEKDKEKKMWGKAFS